MPIVAETSLRATPTRTILLDVRTAAEFSFGSIKGAINIPLDDLRKRIDELPHDKEIIIFCTVGLRGYLAQKILRARGYDNVRNLSGGYKSYSTATAPLIATAAPAQSESKVNIDTQTIVYDKRP